MLTAETPRCDQCRFWAYGLDAGSEWVDQETAHRDERLGSCRRNAPRPTMGQQEFYVLYALRLIAPTDEMLEQHFEEAYLEKVSWPTTEAQDWCGEFSKRDESC